MSSRREGRTNVRACRASSAHHREKRSGLRPRARASLLERVGLGSALRSFALLGVSLYALGCGTVCDDASTICGFEVAPADCVDATECASLCIVDRDSCDVNNPDAPESKCIAACLAEPEET